MRVTDAVVALLKRAPLLPLPVLRIFEGVLAIMFVDAAITLGWLGSVMVDLPLPWVELYGVVLTTPVVIAVTLVFLVCSLWFGFNAVRGGSTPAEGSGRDSARQG
jgi:uncharacterized membrane protein